jgi:asparagine synthase (glutamine-hydrolysing)
VDRHVALGHRRLAVIDVEGGTQPMSVRTDDGWVVIVYSGETYNYVELRDELRRRGHRFDTESDTEVVLRGYLEWGEAVAERLNGMYAFAVWDGRAEKLVMIRDRMGIKPFYCYQTEDGVLFGSEPKAILANPLAERAVDLDGLREVFTRAKTPGAAVWSGMHEIVPGTVVTVDRSGRKEHVYWTLRAQEHRDDQRTSVATVRELLNDIVHRQLVAEVPLCVLLSGGIDSSVITALSAQQLGHDEPVRTFAVDFVGQTDNFRPDGMRPSPDAPYVHMVAEHVGSLHKDIVLSHTAMADPEVRRKVIAAQDIPAGFGDMDISMYLLFEAIREHSTVALSGESADEVFGGYNWFERPEATFPWVAGATSGGPHAQDPDAVRPELAAVLDLPGYLHARYTEALAEVEHTDIESEHERQMRVSSYLHLTRHVRMLLDRKDRMSMAVGLEVRVPFCDQRLVEYVYNTPWVLKTFDGREKSLLRRAAVDVLPRSVVERPKSPYPSTQDIHYVEALQQQGKELLSGDAPVFDLLSRTWLECAVQVDPARMPSPMRNSVERALDMHTWLEVCHPTLRLS